MMFPLSDTKPLSIGKGFLFGKISKDSFVILQDKLKSKKSYSLRFLINFSQFILYRATKHQELLIGGFSTKIERTEWENMGI